VDSCHFAASGVNGNAEKLFLQCLDNGGAVGLVLNENGVCLRMQLRRQKENPDRRL